MKRRTAVINGVLALALVATAIGGWLAIGDPSPATAATDSQTTTVSRGAITSAVTASGNAAAAETRSVGFDGISGTIAEIFVKAGDRVAKGAKLARLDAADAKATLLSAQASLASAKAQLATAQAGQTAAEKARDAAQVSSQQVSVNNSNAQLVAAQQTQSLDKKQHNAIVSAARQTLASAREELADDKARLKSAQRVLESAEAAKDEASAKTAEADVASYENQIEQGETSVTQAVSALAQAERTRESTLLRDSQAVTSQSGQLAAARKQLASQQASAAVNAQPVKEGPVASAKAQLQTAQVQVDSAQDALDSVVLLAPMSGTIAAVNGSVGASSGTSSAASSSGTGSGATTGTATATATTSSSSGLFTLIDVTALEVVAQIAEADAVKVNLDQSATATFSAAGLTVRGVVTAIDVEQTITNNVVTYGVTVSLTEPPDTLRIGQSASISIVAGSKQDVLRAASNAVTTRGPQSTVTVRRDGKDEVVPVQTGLVGNGGTEITSGVNEGDTLVVPAAAGSTGGFTFPGGRVGGGLGSGLGGAGGAR